MQRPIFTCLIRTHHITSRKKVAKIRKAAAQLDIDRVLLRSGGSPGIMFAQDGDESALTEWVAAVQALRYKDFQCVRKPALAEAGQDYQKDVRAGRALDGFAEVEDVKDFAGEMEQRGLGTWWKKAMGYDKTE